MAEQNTNTEIGDDTKEEIAGTADTLWGSGDFSSSASAMMDSIPQIPTSEERFLDLSEQSSFDNPSVSGLEAGNTAASVPECPSAMYGPYLPDEPEPQSADVKDSTAEKGVCGLKNLGNTCFMNSGLQCLLSCAALCKFFLEEEIFMHDSLAGRFHNLVQKVWCGEYSLLHPSEFKETLGFVHVQFKDFRQHDGQEFLALLLDSLHEELNHAKNKEGLDVQPDESISDDSNDLLNEPSVRPSTSVCKHLDIKTSEEDEESSRSEMSISEQEESMDVTALEQDEQTDSATNNITKLPSIEEFYMKDVKTLNTNVLREESPPPVIAIDSEKFPKNDKSPTTNKKSPLKNKVENKTDTSPKSPRNKKTNLLVEKKKKVENLATDNDNEKIQLEVIEGGSEIDTIKRMKMDDSGTILKSLLYKGGVDVLGDTSLDIFSITHDLGDVEKVKQDLAKLRKKDTNLFANSLSKFPVSANNESCNIYDEQDKLGKFASNTFGLELNMECEKPVNCKKPQGEDEEAETEEEEEVKFKGAKFDEGAVCKQITFANNQTLLVNEVSLSKSSTCTSGTTVCMNSPRQNRAMLEYMQAEKAWHKYLERNRSVIVDTFQGQFKSTVVCSACDHVSVTFEPFMYLSLPLPHAMERQIAVVWVPLNHHQPMRYLVNLIKTQTVKQLRVNLMTMIFGENVPPPNDVVLAEVFDNHVARVLEDGTHLRYVNDDYRQIYAFEMAPKPDLNIMHPNNLYCSYGDFVMADSGDDNRWRTRDDDVITESGDVSTAIDDVTTDDITTENTDVNNTEDSNDVVMQSAEKDYTTDAAQGDVFSNIGYFDAGMLGNYDSRDMQSDAMQQTFSQPNNDWNVPSNSNAPTTLTDEVDSADINNQTGDVSTSWVPNNADTHPWTDDTLNQYPNNESNIAVDWRSCAVCLEELPNHELLTHLSCGGSLCHVCLEATSKHYGTAGFQCPVCTAEVNPAEDFVAAPPPTDEKASKRVLSIPVQFRYDYEEDGQRKMKLFGHPRMVFLANEIQGEVLFCAIERLMPFQSVYKIVLTDGQGYHCSRCMYNLHCSGCELVREVDISLQSGDHLTVVYDDVIPHQFEYSEQMSDHESMNDLRKQTPLTLQDCFRAFTESELLDEHNPWYCPKCEQNQCARKTLTVWRYPETLVVYLKRFVFHELCSTKLDNKVLFPVEGLDVSGFISGPVDDSLVYDLQSCVCHFGGVNAGHYTAYSKNALTGPWYYYNDEMTSQQEPNETDASSVYVLFYQRRGPQMDFLPASSQPRETHPDQNNTRDTSDLIKSLGKEDSEEDSAINHEEIDRLLEQLQSCESNDDGTQGDNSNGEKGFDFYN